MDIFNSIMTFLLIDTTDQRLISSEVLADEEMGKEIKNRSLTWTKAYITQFKDGKVSKFATLCTTIWFTYLTLSHSLFIF